MGRRLKIALLIGSSRRYRRDLLCGIAAYAHLHGPWSFFHQEKAPGHAVPAWLKAWHGDGIIASIESSKLAGQIRQMGLPTVDLLGLHEGEGISAFDVDYDACAQLAADHLIERGFERFAFCGLVGVHYSENLCTAFERYLHCMGHKLNVYEAPRRVCRVAAVTAELKGLRHEEALGKWLKSLPKPLGLLCCNDLRAQQAINACGECGIVAPDEVAVIGADNDEVLCELSDPPLSSIDPNAKRMGYEGAALLDHMIQGQPPPVGRTLIKPLGIVARESTNVLAVADPAVAKAMCYIREHACEGITVGDICQHLHYSHSTLLRAFANALGRSPKDEILRVRLQRVRQFLTETDYPLARIARLSGFSYVENMCNLFKSKAGRTPGQYRKESQAQKVS